MSVTAAWRMVSGMASTVRFKTNARKIPIVENKGFALMLR